MASRASSRAPLGAPLFLLNLKAYPGCLGPGALKMGELLERLGAEHQVPVALAAPTPDLSLLAQSLRIPVLAQHVDPRPTGASTGWTVPESLAASGVRGSLVNHSEHRIAPADLVATVQRMAEASLPAVVCAQEEREAGALASSSHPAYLAVEPPELIGGKVSVSKARPEVVSGSVRTVRAASPTTRLLCGAGVQDGEDVRRALELGAEGVLVASAVATSPDPESSLRRLLSGFSARR